MKDLKENIKKNNMKKLVLSVALGMFCYCTNNAMDEEPEEENPEEEGEITDIKKVLVTMLFGQMDIEIAISNILLDTREKIYSAIKKEEKEVTKKNVLDFIINIYTQDEQNEKGFQDNINKIEQYFHLEEIKNDNDECNEKNLTETFWTETEAEEDIKDALTTEETTKIKEYFNTIIKAENDLSTVFKSYYNAKKKKKEKANEAAKYEDILGEIMKDCCGEETKSYPVTNFIKNLKNLWEVKNENVKKNILLKIKRRITLSDNIQKQAEDFISFLKQKIGIEEKKEEEKINPKPKVEEEGGCPYCDCWGKKKNQVENESSKEKPVKIYKN